MKGYRIVLVILLVIVVGCGALYFYDVFKDHSPHSDGVLVRACGTVCGGEA